MPEHGSAPARPDAAPVLVTGTHRSGTTWVGEMLAKSRELHYVHEPFAPMYERSWMREPPLYEYYHEPPFAIGRYAADLERIVALQPPWSSIARRAPGPRNVFRLSQGAIESALARRRGARALIKDPFALLSAEWVATRFGARIIVLVRHPAAFASSVKRLGWRLDVSCLLDQELLMETDLAPFRADLERDRRGELDLIDHAALVWRALNSVCWRYHQEYENWNVLRYETIANDPVSRLQSLYDAVDVTWNQRIAATIARQNSGVHARDAPAGEKGGTVRNSRAAIWTWLNRLTRDEIHRIRQGTEDVAHLWYTEADWEPH